MEAEKITIVKSAVRKSRKKAVDEISTRKTPEQVVALCGSIGSGLPEIAGLVGSCFQQFSYVVHKIKASDLILESIRKIIDGGQLKEGCFQLRDWDSEGERIESLQKMGDYLRQRYGNDVVAQLFIKKISTNRQAAITDEEAEDGTIQKGDRRHVWIIDSLKHPEEEKILRLVYDKMFSLFGVLCADSVKTYNLVHQMSLTKKEADALIEIDKSEDFSHGQKLTKTLHLGDFFVRNAQYMTGPRVEQSIERFVKLLIGDHSVTPKPAEYAMYLAQSAAYRSGCMSRQVGAAIIGPEGDVVSTGFNDVPKKDGGLYTEDSSQDARCFNITGGKCKNDLKKSEIKKFLKAALKNDHSLNIKSTEIDKLFNDSGLSDLTEYCRAVHGEMDAITSAARTGSSIRGATMYVTTFPCHNCAKHIIASGIKEVYYIEPYEKSLAISLHEDSISTSGGNPNKLEFLPFEGVAPRQYQNMFISKTEKKKNGKFVKINLDEHTQTYAQLMDSFADYELKVVECLSGLGL